MLNIIIFLLQVRLQTRGDRNIIKVMILLFVYYTICFIFDKFANLKLLLTLEDFWRKNIQSIS